MAMINIEHKHINEIKSRFLDLSEKILPYTFYRYFFSLYQQIKAKGKTSPYGEAYFLKWRPFSKKKYCIIRLEYPDFGVMAAARRNIFMNEYAISKGMYPIIDLKCRMDFEKGLLNGMNLWENVFQQKKVQDILKENATILVCGINEGASWYLDQTCIDVNNEAKDCNIHATDDNWREYYGNIHTYVKRYWKFNQNIVCETKRKEQEMFNPQENVLGVSLREPFSGEVYALINNIKQKEVFNKHPQGPDIDEILNIVAEYLDRWRCDKIFVASVFSESIKRFEERFSGKIVCCDRKRRSVTEYINIVNSQEGTSDDATSETPTKIWYKEEREYVQETIILSKCDYMIGAKSGQTIAALSLNGGRYKDIKVLEDKNHIDRY